MNKRSLLIIAIIFILLFIIGGSTYAYWTWHFTNEYQTNVTFTTGAGFSCSASGGGNITEQEVQLAPSICTNDNYTIKRQIITNTTNSTNSPLYMNLWLDIKSIASELSATENFRYAISDSDNWCSSGNLISSGSFHNATNDGKVYLLSNDLYALGGNASKTYYLYIWLDYVEEEDSTMNKPFHFELGGECRTDNASIPNTPDVVDNLIPVKLSASGDTVKAISANNPSWYDYDNQKWANAVLVTDGNRSNYQNLSINQEVTIPESEILAYYVWIPRYSYKVWAYTGSDLAGDPHEISIKFVDTLTKDTASAINDWYTHPAFWWDDDSDGVRDAGEELSGIWVGKFETSHIDYATNASSSLECTFDACANYRYNKLRILPNVRSLTDNSVSSFFYVSRAMSSSGNAFGINPDTTDTHMMKNSEWGAVAYLSHSKYGINDEIRINNTYNITYNGATRTYLTGCGAGTPNEAAEAACDIQYGTVSSGIYPQSTTGNVTGVFDMSGGTSEYVMGTYDNDNSYDNVYSGFNSSPNQLPNSKYYNNYTFYSFDSCTLATCGGHALNETMGWYSDLARFAYSSIPWFMRGGNYSLGSYTGAFDVIYSFGGEDNRISARFVLLTVSDDR